MLYLKKNQKGKIPFPLEYNNLNSSEIHFFRFENFSILQVKILSEAFSLLRGSFYENLPIHLVYLLPKTDS